MVTAAGSSVNAARALAGADAAAAATSAPPAASSEWTIAGWLDSYSLGNPVVVAALHPPAGTDAFQFAKTTLNGELTTRLEKAKLQGLEAPIREAIVALAKQKAATGTELNSKFSGEGGGAVFALQVRRPRRTRLPAPCALSPNAPSC